MWTFEQVKPFLAVFGAFVLGVLFRGAVEVFWRPSGWEYLPYYVCRALPAAGLGVMVHRYTRGHGRSTHNKEG